MNRGTAARTQSCGSAEARAKLSRAKRFFETADLVKDEPDPDFLSVAGALARFGWDRRRRCRVLQDPRFAVPRPESPRRRGASRADHFRWQGGSECAAMDDQPKG